MTYLVEIPTFALAPNLPAPPLPSVAVPPAPQLPVAQPTSSPVAVNSVIAPPRPDERAVERAVDFSKLASHDPFLALKLQQAEQVKWARTMTRNVTAAEATASLAPHEVLRYNAIADGLAGVAKLRDATTRLVTTLNTASALGYGAFLLCGASFDAAVLVGIGALVAITFGKLQLTDRCMRRVDDRQLAMFNTLQALPPASTDPRASADDDSAKKDQPYKG